MSLENMSYYDLCNTASSLGINLDGFPWIETPSARQDIIQCITDRQKKNAVSEAQRQREQEERRERLRDIATGVNHFDDCVVDGDSITFRAFGHRFVIREVE